MRVWHEEDENAVRFAADTKEERTLLVELARPITECFAEGIDNIRGISMIYEVGGRFELKISFPIHNKPEAAE